MAIGGFHGCPRLTPKTLFDISLLRAKNGLDNRVHFVPQCLLGENAEKAFDHVHPRGVRWSVVEMHPRMSQQPLFGPLRSFGRSGCPIRREVRQADRTSPLVSSIRLKKSTIVRRSRTCGTTLPVAISRAASMFACRDGRIRWPTRFVRA
jgi:hypothetical protein